MRKSLALDRIVLVCALSTALATTACDRSEPTGTPGEASGAVTAEGTGTAVAAEGTGTGAAAEGTGAAAQADGSDDGNFVVDGSGNQIDCRLEAAGEGGGLVCPPGCVMIKGAPVDETNSCARVGLRWEVAMGCIAPPVSVLPGGACYVDSAGHHILTAITYSELLDQGWSMCGDDYAYRAAPPCPAQVLPTIPAEGSAAPAAPTAP
jgi:hypothetical protein